MTATSTLKYSTAAPETTAPDGSFYATAGSVQDAIEYLENFPALTDAPTKAWTYWLEQNFDEVWQIRLVHQVDKSTLLPFRHRLPYARRVSRYRDFYDRCMIEVIEYARADEYEFRFRPTQPFSYNLPSGVRKGLVALFEKCIGVY